VHTVFNRAALALLAFTGSSAATQSCLPPPIQNEAHAICVAGEHLREPNRTWETGVRTEQTANGWVVHYAPKSAEVRGGGGSLFIVRETGAVKLLKGER
jgi:hypothetical protein